MIDLIAQCQHKLEELNALRPIGAEQEARILQKLHLDWDYHSNHLEGNSLSYGETKALILHGLTAQGKPIKDHIELTGHHEAIRWIEDLVRKKEPLTEVVIRELHQLILHEDHYIEAQTPEGLPTRLLVEVGKYKSTPNHIKTITGETLFFSTPLDTPIQMRELMSWYSEHSDGEPIQLASEFHHRFTRIHPFSDGNGRVARLVTNFILMMAGYPPVIVKSQEKESYFAALRLADSGNDDALSSYFCEQLLMSLDLVTRGAKGESIEEPDDIQKQVALLKLEFQDDERKVNVIKSPERVQEAWELWIRPLLRLFASRASQFDEFYLAQTLELSTSSNRRFSGPIEDQLSSVQERMGGAREITAQILFEKVRTREHVQLAFLAKLVILFLETHMEIWVGDPRKKVADVDWDQIPTLAEQSGWISVEEKRHVAFLTPLVSRKKRQ